ncbi:MAG: hypothetical protein ABIN35_00620 [candidate division WOR-3 bacterium]
MRNIIVLLFFIGIISIVIGYINQIKVCPPSPIEYRYIPRSFEDEQNDPVRVSKLFRNMFEEATPWLGGTRIGFNKPNIFTLNRYNI